MRMIIFYNTSRSRCFTTIIITINIIYTETIYIIALTAYGLQNRTKTAYIVLLVTATRSLRNKNKKQYLFCANL